jgi:hypothetical protein
VDYISEPDVECPDQSLAGRKIYSPVTIGVYTALANLPMGFILYGANLKARGQRRIGLSMIWFGCATLVLLLLDSLAAEATHRFAFQVLGVLGAMSVYQLEKRPFDAAIRAGAERARWWPPAVVLLVTMSIVVLVSALSR